MNFEIFEPNGHWQMKKTLAVLDKLDVKFLRGVIAGDIIGSKYGDCKLKCVCKVNKFFT